MFTIEEIEKIAAEYKARYNPNEDALYNNAIDDLIKELKKYDN